MMRSKSLQIFIHKPASVVFEFTINPINTPLWIPTVINERISDLPVHAGTIFFQTVETPKGPEERSFIVESIDYDKELELRQLNSFYVCRYSYENVDCGTNLSYFEENLDGSELTDPTDISQLLRLKNILESS